MCSAGLLHCVDFSANALLPYLHPLSLAPYTCARVHGTVIAIWSLPPITSVSCPSFLKSFPIEQSLCRNNPCASGVALWGGDPSGAPSCPTVEPLPQLVDVRLGSKQSRRDASSFAACVLTDASCLTRLEMSSGVKAANMYVPGFDPAVLKDKPHLQHLELGGCALDGSVGVAQLLSALQQMQVSHISCCCWVILGFWMGSMPSCWKGSGTQRSLCTCRV